MELPSQGDLITPADDPYQFNPAWRSVVAGFLFAEGARTAEDLDSLAATGEIVASSGEEPKKESRKKKSSGKPKPARKGAGGEAEPRKPVMRGVWPLTERPEYRAFAADQWIRAQVFMLRDEVAGGELKDCHVPLRLAARWYAEMEHEAAMRKRIEPLLLTEIGMDVIAADLTGTEKSRPAFEAYEKLYFNCRDDAFALSGSQQLVQRFAMPWGPLKTFLRKYEELDGEGYVIGDGRPLAKESDVWRAVAATMGYEALMYVWRWDRRAHGLKEGSLERMIELSWRAAASRLFSDIFNGDIKHEDAARVLAAYTSQAKKISDDRNGSASAGSSDTTKALMAVLYQTSPQMVQFDAEEDAARNEEIQGRIQSQLAISRQKIEDRGKKVEAEVVDAQIAAAVRGE